MNDVLTNLKLSLLNVGYAKVDQTWDYADIVSPFSRLYLILGGSAKVYHHQQVFTLKENHLYLIPSFTNSKYKCDSHMEQYYVCFMEEIGTGFSIYNRYAFLYEKEASALEISLFERLLAICPNRALPSYNTKVYDNPTQLKLFLDLNDGLSAKNHIEVQGLLKILFSTFISADKNELYSASSTQKKMYDIQQYISEHLSENLPVDHLAKQCHLNADYFSRIFKESTGVRPVIYLQNKRIERAQLLLTTTTYQLQEIAEMVGLSNISYFNRLFTRICQVTPLAYRKNHWSV